MSDNKRLEIAKDLLAAMLSNPAFYSKVNDKPALTRTKEFICERALDYADELISQESKKKAICHDNH